MKAVLYIHGKNGSSEEAEHYRPVWFSRSVRYDRNSVLLIGKV